MCLHSEIFIKMYIHKISELNSYQLKGPNGNSPLVAMTIVPVYGFQYNSPVKGTSIPWSHSLGQEIYKIYNKMCLGTCSIRK